MSSPRFSGRATGLAAKRPLVFGSSLLTLAWCLLHFAFSSPVRADIQAPPKANSKGERQLQRRTPPPPSPVATKVRLQPGGSAEIVLQANGALGKSINFLLRTPPAHGAFVGSPRRIGPDSMAITYVHRAADGPGHDAFTFAAQAQGTAVSAAETVDIEIVDAAPGAAPVSSGLPDLAARPVELDFGAVATGSSGNVTLTLENRGGGLATGRLDPPAPWAVDGDASYSLGRGGTQTFRFVFRPQAEGSFAETLRVDTGNADSTTGCVVRLIGTGLPTPTREPLATPVPSAVVPVAAASVSPTPAPSAAQPREPLDSPPPARSTSDSTGSGTAVANEAQVTAVKVIAVGASTVELAWQPPVPLPRSYRVELRSFAYDEREEGKVRIDWLPYARTDFRVHAAEVRATLRGLNPGEPLTVRVVSVDADGQLSQPSPLVEVVTAAGSTWWRPTALKTLVVLLAICGGLMARKRWQERQLLRELDTRQAVADEQPSFRPGSG